MKYIVLYNSDYELDTLCVCDSVSDAFEMALSYAEEEWYNIWAYTSYLCRKPASFDRRDYPNLLIDNYYIYQAPSI